MWMNFALHENARVWRLLIALEAATEYQIKTIPKRVVPASQWNIFWLLGPPWATTGQLTKGFTPVIIF